MTACYQKKHHRLVLIRVPKSISLDPEALKESLSNLATGSEEGEIGEDLVIERRGISPFSLLVPEEEQEGGEGVVGVMVDSRKEVESWCVVRKTEKNGLRVDLANEDASGIPVLPPIPQPKALLTPATNSLHPSTSSINNIVSEPIKKRNRVK